MANLTLAPEDDPDFPEGHTFKLFAGEHGDDSSQRTELQDLRIRFNPHKVGFGILPWPGVSQAFNGKDTVVVAMKYLIDGKDLRGQEDKK